MASHSNSTVATSQVGSQPSGTEGNLFALTAGSAEPVASEPFGSLDTDDMDVDQPVVPPVEVPAGSANGTADAHSGHEEAAEHVQQQNAPQGDAPGLQGQADMRAAIAKLA